ncbi:MAG TPA: acyl-CoA dehydrogenase family protein, partial [Dehalococcoidia bacterium]
AEYGGSGLNFLEHAYMNEVLAYAVGAASLFGVVAPNSGNQQILLKYGTDEQKKKWLIPLIEQKMESGFSMTEPDNPGSDPRSIKTTATRDGDEWVINGHKWFTSNGKRADFFIVMCRTDDPDGPADRNGKMTQIIVPKDTPGVNIIRGVGIWGAHDSDHCEIKYENVRVPVTNQLGATGTGHQAAQDRLGAGRIYHCMNSIGQMWRAFDLMVERLMSREVHGGKLETKQFMQGFVADSYIDIQAARLMTIHAAEKIESGNDPRTDISAIKVFVPAAYERVVDRAIQVWGAKGVSEDLPLAGMYHGARTLRIADGPDEVHRILIAKNVLSRYHRGESWDFGN